MITVGQPGGRIFPVGIGTGATHDEWLVMSPIRAASRLLIFTVADPLAIIPGPPGAHPGSVHGLVWSVALAAGLFPIITVVLPGGMSTSGSGGWGIGFPAGGCGVWQCGPS